MITETMVMWLVLCVAVAILAYLMRSFPVAVVSSIGFFISSLKIYQEEADFFLMAMLWVVAFTLPFAVDKKKLRV